jgi:hypothetical protein
MFQERFADLVETNLKPHTVRLTALCKPGDVLSLRKWTGKPYRSKQKLLRLVICRNVRTIEIGEDYLAINGPRYNQAFRDVFSRKDGFQNWHDLTEWFKRTHGLPFKGVLIEW